MKYPSYKSTALFLLMTKEGFSAKVSSLHDEQRELPARIVGGQNAGAGMFPWFARGIQSPSGTWWGCGGALVTKEWVLSAAHCTWDSRSYGGFQIGALCPGYTDGDNCDQYVEQFSYDPSSDVFDHPNYNPSTTDFDFSLIRLNGLSTITPVPMDMDNLSDSYTGGETMQPIGFGTTSSGGSSSSTLLYVDVPYVTNEVCNEKYTPRPITDAMMCAGDVLDGGEDACQGDSGGPLYDPENGVLVGVTSWGYGCADFRYPGVYARISNQWEWIKTTICENSQNDYPSFCPDRGPTTSPTTSPPTSSPTPCPDGTLSTGLKVKTDNYPQEISWKLEKSATGEEIATASYTSDQTFELFEYSFGCLNPACYKFTISDTYGDGIMSSAGGYYSLTVEGEEIATSLDDGNGSGDFDYEESTEFGCVTEPTQDPTKAPTDPTPPPSPSPTSSPTTPAPTADESTCPDGLFNLTLDVKTDNYPQETSWLLENTESGTVIDSASYTTDDSFQLFQYSFGCLDPACYKFTIEDTWGDGIMSSAGGYYNLVLDGEVIATSLNDGSGTGDFDFEEITTFGCATEPPTPCPEENMDVVLDLKTDQYAYETSWTLTNTGNGEEIGSKSYTSADAYTLFSESFCLAPGCYEFTITDDYGDGILESQEGFYNLTVDGTTVASSSNHENGDFDNEDSTSFGVCDDADVPTSSPSPSSYYYSNSPSPSGYYYSASPSPSSGYYTEDPTASPTEDPTSSPTSSPTSIPSTSPSSIPSSSPSMSPSSTPTSSPTSNPTSSPTSNPTAPPSIKASAQPSDGTTETGCFSNDYKTCLPEGFDAGASCTTMWLPNGAVTGECLALWAECTGGDDDSCCGPATCFGDASYAICVPEGEDGKGTDSPTASPTAPPTEKPCDLTCNDKGPGSVVCANLSANSLKNRCAKANWLRRKFCRLSCYNAGYGYNGEVCCNGSA